MISIIGLGETGALWDGKGQSIGVNDAWRFGNSTGSLIVVNSFTRFPDRQKIIADSRPHNGLYSNSSKWAHHPNYKHLNLTPFKGKVNDGVVYHAMSSPFIAISLAVTQGFKEIVLYGVDFVNHRVIKNYLLLREIEIYVKFVKALEKQGVKVYLASEFGALKEILPVWDSAQ